MRVLGLCFALSSAVVWAQDLTVNASNSPQIINSAATYQSVTVEDGGVLNANAKITVVGDFVINGGGTVTTDQLLSNGKLELSIGGTLRIDIGAQIDVTAKGLPGGKTINPTTGLRYAHLCSGSCPGSHFVKGFETSPLPSFDAPLNPQFPGGGGVAGSGGGAVLIVADTAVVEGTISADGEDLTDSFSTGAGGTINLTANSVSGSGHLSARGGNAGLLQCCPGTSAGGLILIRAATSSFDGSLNVSPGEGKYNNDPPRLSAGTALWLAPTTRDLTVLGGYYWLRDGESYNSVGARSGATLVLGERASVDLPVVVSSGAKVIVSAPRALDRIAIDPHVYGGGTLQFNVDASFAADFVLEGTLIINQSFSAPNFEARPGALVTHAPGVTSMNLVVAKSLTLANGASVDVTAKGLNGDETINPASLQPEKRLWSACSGGSHAGRGGSFSIPSDVAPDAYDDPDQPRFGGGGGPPCAGSCLSRGGGVARITAGNLQLDGLVAADGDACSVGAAGGSVVITATQFAGIASARIRARGGSPTYPTGGAGGGGIILLKTGASTFSGTKDVAGGTSSKPGEPGAIRETTSTVAPVLTSSPRTFVKVGTTYVYTPSAVGTPPLTWSLLSQPAGATFEASTGTVSWTPASEEVGHFELEVTNLNGKDSQVFFVRAMNPPAIVGMPRVTASLGTAYQYAPQFTGTGPVNWSILYGPDGLTIDPSSGQVSWSPKSPGTYPVCLEVMNEVDQARQCFAIVVLLSDGGVPAIDGPRFESSPSNRATCGQPYHYLPDTPPQVSGSGPFTYSLETPAGTTIPEGLSVDADSGQLEWTPSREQAGSHVVKLTVSGPGGSSSQVFSIEVGCPQSHTFATCGCSSGTSSLLAVLALALWRRRQPRHSTRASRSRAASRSAISWR